MRNDHSSPRNARTKTSMGELGMDKGNISLIVLFLEYVSNVCFLLFCRLDKNYNIKLYLKCFFTSGFHLLKMITT